MITTVFFDFDGVLVESTDVKTAAFTGLFMPEGRSVAEQVREYHLANAGVSRFDKFRFIYKEILKRPLSDNDFRSLCDRFSGLVLESVIRAPFVRGAREFLEQHYRTCKFYVVTATPKEEIDLILERRGITRLFSGIFGAPLSKTDAVHRVLQQERLTPSETVYVGDALSDYEAARANNVPFIARIHDNAGIFHDIQCAKIPDLSGLSALIFPEARAGVPEAP